MMILLGCQILFPADLAVIIQVVFHHCVINHELQISL